MIIDQNFFHITFLYPIKGCLAFFQCTVKKFGLPFKMRYVWAQLWLNLFDGITYFQATLRPTSRERSAQKQVYIVTFWKEINLAEENYFVTPYNIANENTYLPGVDPTKLFRENFFLVGSTPGLAFLANFKEDYRFLLILFVQTLFLKNDMTLFKFNRILTWFIHHLQVFFIMVGLGSMRLCKRALLG